MKKNKCIVKGCRKNVFSLGHCKLHDEQSMKENKSLGNLFTKALERVMEKEGTSGMGVTWNDSRN